ncbi:MAG: SPOR domain-containing protein [Alphaproteobacteria bacterium]|nr:SPOR domain-containing protein [Alphaproteobacteria bacterium]
MSDRYRDREDDEADLEYEEAEPPKRRGRLLAALIALFAIGGFGGVLWYAYSQGQRSADAVAPILKADGEQTRARPEQPGGMVVPHQDKLVLNNMQQANRGQVEKLLPPAEAPLPQTARTAPPPATSVALAPPPAAAPAPPPVPPAPPPSMAAPAPSPVSPPSPPPPSPATSAGSLIAPPAPPPVPPAPSSASAPPAATPPSVMSPPPPSAPPQVAARPSNPPPAMSAPRAAAGGSVGAGGGSWRVQLGSFPAAEQANAQWDRLKKAHAELQPLDLTTVRVDLGDKGVWYRLQAGPLNEPGARSLCEELKAKKRDCLVVRP